MAVDTSLAFNILARDQASRTFEKVGKNVDKTSKKFDKFKATVTAAAAAGAVALVSFGKSSIDAAKDLGESLNKSQVLFGEQADAIEKFANSAATSLGMSKRAALDATSTFATFGKAAGLTGDDLTAFSTDLTTLAADLASFSNTTPQEAIDALGAALRGESEPIRKYGVLLDDATLRNRALQMGLIESTKEALTPQQKALAAQAEIMAQTTDAQGDFARTADSAANKEKILKARTEDISASLGQKLLPLYERFLIILEKVIRFVERHSAVLLPLLAIIGTIIVAIKAWTAAQAILNVVMALNPIGLVIVAIAGLVAGIVVAYQKSETFRNFVSKLWAVLKDGWNWIKRTWPLLLSTGPFGAAAAFITKNWDSIINFVKKLPGRIKRAAGGMWDGIKDAFRSAINTIIRWWNNLSFPSITVGGQSLGPLGKIPSFTFGGWSLPNIPLLAEGGIVTKPTLAVLGEGSHDEAVVPLSKARGSLGTTINVTVNGAVGDPQAIARMIHTELLRMQRSGTRLGFVS